MGQGKSNSSHSKMKAVIILGALALVLVSGLEQNEEESQLSLSEGTLQREARDADPQSRKKGNRNQKKKKGKKGAARRKSKGRKGAGKRGAKKVRNNQNNKKRGGKNNKRRKMKKAKSGSGRQSTECLADVVTAIKGYRSAGNQKRMAMRISAWKKNMGKKKDKAATQFGDAADSLDAATGGGQSCGSGKPDSDTTDALAKLKNCSKSAAALCDNSNVNDTGAEDCKAKFEEYITAFDKCVNNPTCDCFKALTPVESSCKFNDANAAAKAAKDKCFKSDTPGSFGDCSSALKKASGKIGKCGLGVGTGPVGTTTKSARNLRRLAFAKF